MRPGTRRNQEQPVVYYTRGPPSQGQSSQLRNHERYYPPPNAQGAYLYQNPPFRYGTYSSPQRNYEQHSGRNNLPNEEGSINFSRNSDDVEGVRLQNTNAFEDAKIRNVFTRKVFILLSIQLLFNCVVIALFTYIQPLRNFVYTYPYLSIFPLIFYIVIACGLTCSEDLRRKFPCNLILLGLITICVSIVLGFSVAMVKPESVLMAVGITAGVTFTLTVFAMQTKWDITGLGGYLILFMVIIVACGIAMFFIPRNKYIQILFSGAVAILASIFLVYDVQLMLGGKHKYNISPEDYIMADVCIYIDIINIFLSILKIISLTDD